MTPALRTPAATVAAAYVPVYRLGEHNRCPACSRSHFIVGRSSVECAFCQTAMPIAGGDEQFAGYYAGQRRVGA